MKKITIIIGLCMAIGALANDTTLNRVVTVEKTFQPVIQNAGKINQRPLVLQHEAQLNPVVYSTYSAPLAIAHNIPELQAAKTDFAPQKPLNGILEGAVGHRNTHFLFGYQINEKKKTSLDLYATHDAYWGRDALSQSRIGAQFTYHLRKADIYIDMEGQNDYWQYNPYRNTIWGAQANIGVVNTKKQAIEYRIQTGYKLCYPNSWQIEHQVRSIAQLSWTNETHKAGVKAQVQNFFYQHPNNQQSPLHAIRVEPYYEYHHKNLHLHAGVNIDMNVDKNIGISGPIHPIYSNIDGLGFMPSPNIHVDWHTKNNIFLVYADIEGYYGTSAMTEQLAYNPFLSLNEQSTTKFDYARSIMDATLGMKLRPLKTLLIDIYGGYAMRSGEYLTLAHIGKEKSDVYYTATRSAAYQQAKVGAKLHYHYRDIIELNAAGNYYFYLAYGGTIYERPDWDATARLDIHFDSKWSIYSENYFAGGRWALTTDNDQRIKPMISLNIGGQYAINRWLSVYVQVNDYLNRKDEIFYGRPSQGIHFLLGAKWQF